MEKTMFETAKKRWEKIEGLGKTIEEINDYNNLARRVMFDISDASIWVDVFASLNSWNEYHDSDIIEVWNSRPDEASWDEDNPDFMPVTRDDILDSIDEALNYENIVDEDINELLSRQRFGILFDLGRSNRG
ncbi:MAG: hypothetical protein LBB61_07875 [Treponema sp.]|nr:hypothetical protein [Treponema sp.]